MVEAVLRIANVPRVTAAVTAAGGGPGQHAVLEAHILVQENPVVYQKGSCALLSTSILCRVVKVSPAKARCGRKNVKNDQRSATKCQLPNENENDNNKPNYRKCELPSTHLYISIHNSILLKIIFKNKILLF